MPKNGYRSHRGRSAVARRAINTNSTNGMMPNVTVTDQNGVERKTAYYGGPMKGGSAPSATGNMISFGKRSQIAPGKAAPASKPNFFFQMKTKPGPSPFGFGPHA